MANTTFNMPSLVVFCTALLAAGCLTQPTPDDIELSKAEQDFSIQLFQDLTADSYYVKDVFFSPFSVFSDFLTAYVASAGATEQSLHQFLHLNKLNKNYIKEKVFHGSLITHSNQSLYVLSSVDRIFYTPDYKVTKTGEVEFGSKVAVFKSKDPAEELNKWVADETHGMIREIVNKNSIPTTQSVIFANAAYFKGYWTIPLNAETKTMPFTLANGNVRQTAFMHPPKDEQYKLLTDNELKAKVISLPYKGDDVSMIIILPTTKPQKHASPAVAEVVKKLTNNKFRQLVADLETQQTIQTDLLIPKFESEERYELKEIWEKYEKTKLFSAPWDLSNLFEHGQGIQVGGVVHKAMVKVSENGTEAAAVTAIISGAPLYPPPPAPATFHADHPFIYLIYDKAHSFIHYMGILNDPKQIK